jgi:hypothetical protein
VVYVLKVCAKMYTMKKIMLTAILGLISIQFIMAQEKVEFGIKGGLNFSSLKGDGIKDGDTRTSFHLGGLAHFHINKMWAIQPELMYSAQGASYSNGQTVKLNYFNLPVLGQYMFGDGFRLETGPQFGFNVNSKSDFDGVETDVNDNYKGFGLSWAFGIGYLTKGGLGFDARYNAGLTDISENNSNIKNSVWQLGLFYQFRPTTVK